jgi:hypothetical protein
MVLTWVLVWTYEGSFTNKIGALKYPYTQG